MTNIVALHRHEDTRPCDTEFAPVIDTRYLAVHMAGAEPKSALDGRIPPRKPNAVAWCLIIGAAVACAIALWRLS